MTPEVLERIRVSAEDLSYLRREWDQDVSDSSLRRSSPILRRLLVDGLLQRAWRDLNLERQPIIRTPSLDVKLRHLALSKVTFAQAGGGKHREIVVTTVVEYGDYLSQEQALKEFGSSPDDAPERDFLLQDFVKSTCIVVKGTSIDRHTIIKYVANKLGGVHLDPRRDLNKEEELKFTLLDEVRVERVTCDKPAIYFEYLAIGQALINSPDIDRFLAIAATATGEHYG